MEVNELELQIKKAYREAFGIKRIPRKKKKRDKTISALLRLYAIRESLLIKALDQRISGARICFLDKPKA